jgi:hypothetical protein
MFFYVTADVSPGFSMKHIPWIPKISDPRKVPTKFFPFPVSRSGLKKKSVEYSNMQLFQSQKNA